MPELSDGYTRIANEIMEALARTRIPGEARQVLDTIFRYTYGFHKKESFIKKSTLIQSTGLARQNINRSLKILGEMNIIRIKSDSKNNTKYMFNKYFNTWKKRIRDDSVNQKRFTSESKVIRFRIKSDSKPPTRAKRKLKDNIKDNIIKGKIENLNKLLQISLNFHKEQQKSGLHHEEFKNELTKQSDIIINGTIELEKLNRINKEPIEEIESVINYALSDMGNNNGWAGWKNNLISLSSIRKKTNGEMKYFKIKNSMRIANERFKRNNPKNNEYAAITTEINQI